MQTAGNEPRGAIVARRSRGIRRSAARAPAGRAGPTVPQAGAPAPPRCHGLEQRATSVHRLVSTTSRGDPRAPTRHGTASTCDERVPASRSTIVDGCCPELGSPQLKRRCVSSRPYRDERLDRVGGARDDRVGVVLGRERREDEVGDVAWIAPPRPTDADAQPEEVGAAEASGDRAQPVVAGEAAAEASLEAAERRDRPRRGRRGARRAASCRTRPPAAPSGRSRSCTCPA